MKSHLLRSLPWVFLLALMVLLAALLLLFVMADPSARIPPLTLDAAPNQLVSTS